MNNLDIKKWVCILGGSERMKVRKLLIIKVIKSSVNCKSLWH